MAHKMRSLVLVGAGGAAAYFLDPDNGKGRRTRTADQVRATLRRQSRAADKQLRYAEGVMQGEAARAQGAGQTRPVDDRAVVDAIKQQLAQLEVPTSDVVVEVVDGVATLRGQATDPEQIEAVELAALDSPGVHEVHSYLHLPGVPAPNKAAAIRASHTGSPRRSSAPIEEGAEL